MAERPLILFLITDLHLGSSPRMLADLVTGLRTFDDFDLLVVSIAPLPGPPADVSVPDRIRQADIEVFSLAARSSKDPGILPRFVKLLKKRRPSIVLSILIHANILSALARPFVSGCRFIHSIHTLQPRPRWHWWAQGMISSFADGFVAPTQAIIDRVSLFGLVQSASAIPNGIDVKCFQNALPFPPRLSPAPPGTPLIGYVGRFDPVKNLPNLIAAYHMYVIELQRVSALIPHLVLVGWGAEELQLRQQVLRLNLQDLVHFPGPTHEPERWYKSFSCLVLASEIEGYGLVVAESLAAGTPVLAVESPAIRAIVGDKYPLCKNSDPESLLSGLKEVIVSGRLWITSRLQDGTLIDKLEMARLYNNFFKKFFKHV